MKNRINERHTVYTITTNSECINKWGNEVKTLLLTECRKWSSFRSTHIPSCAPPAWAICTRLGAAWPWRRSVYTTCTLSTWPWDFMKAWLAWLWQSLRRLAAYQVQTIILITLSHTSIFNTLPYKVLNIWWKHEKAKNMFSHTLLFAIKKKWSLFGVSYTKSLQLVVRYLWESRLFHTLSLLVYRDRESMQLL